MQTDEEEAISPMATRVTMEAEASSSPLETRSESSEPHHHQQHVSSESKSLDLAPTHVSSSTYTPLRVALLSTIFLTLISVTAMEVIHATSKGQNIWGDFRQSNPAWCEAEGADRTNFLIEPWNCRSDYTYVAWGYFLLSIGVSDIITKRSLHHMALLLVGPIPPETEHLINPMMRYPHITIGNGIVNLLHGIGSFWFHACECTTAGRWDVAGMLAVMSLPLFYTVVQALPYAWYVTHRLKCFGISTLVPLGQLMVWMAVLLNGAGNSSERVKGMMSTNLVFIGLMLVGRLLQKKRNKAVDAVDEGNHGRLLYHEQNGFLVFSALPLFFLGFICWNMDKNGTWCNPRSWWQGHAIWHLFTCMALIVLYYFYRLERIVRVVQP